LKPPRSFDDFDFLLAAQEGEVVVLESADPEYFVPHVDLTKVAEYTAEAAKAGGPGDASLAMLWHKLSELPVVTIAEVRGRARAASWPSPSGRRQRLVEFPAGGDAQFGEHLAQVPFHGAGAEE
jgi:hypothetical protein